MKKNAIYKITFSGVFIALLVVLQWSLGALSGSNQFIVGSGVNLVLIMAALLGGAIPGSAVAVISPFIAFMFGIGPQFIQFIPFIALGNLTIVLVWHFICRGNHSKTQFYIRMLIALIAGSIAKFIVLYLSIVRLAAPYLVDLNEKQVANISKMFSYPQLITALIGGIIAIAVAPVLKKAVKNIIK